MKNLICVVLMTIGLLSCQKKESVIPVNEGSFFFRFVDKNETNKPFSSYNTVEVIVAPKLEQSNNESVDIVIRGWQDAQNEFNTSLVFSRNKTKPISFYYPDRNLMIDSIYCVSTYKSDRKNFLLGNMPNRNLDERLIITKDDADSLAGKFKINLVDDGVLLTGSRQMEGYFSIAKKGRF